uniref:Uncharacterized protein n=1 Tax=candidate division WOR-3 bacterium TaxID=2052148 RepID=A0A7C6EB00_UNCW3
MRQKHWLILLLLISVCVLGTNFAIASSIKNRKPCLCDVKLTPYKGKYPDYYIAYAKYSDPDGDIPSKIVVYVDNTCYPLGLVKIIKKPYPGVESFEAFYQAAIALPPGEHRYYFYTEDGRGKSDRNPRYGVVKSPFVGVRRLYNRAPVLKEGGALRQQGTDRDHYVYSVWYYDPEYYEDPSRPPKEVCVFVDGIKIPMKLHKGTANNGLYLVDYAFPEDKLRAYQYENEEKDTKRHAFFFRAVDADGFCTYLPEDGYIQGPEVSLDENHPPRLLDPRIEPPLGTENMTYTYYVTYEDQDNDPPAYINCVINGKNHRMKLLTGLKHKGIYYCKTNHFYGTQHTYYFYAADGRKGETRLPEVGKYFGPAVVK